MKGNKTKRSDLMNTLKNKQHVNKSSQQEGFFAAPGLCPANQENHGL
ncbi:hypothetical protein [Mucilaginibacter sp. HD30]